MPRFKPSKLVSLSRLPEAGHKDWLAKAEDLVAFLRENAQEEEIVIYASGPHVLIHGVLAPLANLTPPYADELHTGMFPSGDESWVIQKAWGGGEGHRIYLEPPFGLEGESVFSGGEKLIYRRSFRGVDEGRSSIELSQKLVHSLDLHFVPARNAYCRLDQRGEIEDVIRVMVCDLDAARSLDIVTILRKDLDAFMALSATALVLRFDATRMVEENFPGWGAKHTPFQKNEADGCYHGGTDAPGSYVNGSVVVRSNVTVDQLIEAWKEEENPANRKYATFKFYDRKNDRTVESSCAPEFRANYFVKSDLPWDISPAFFRPEVLHRFKADPERFDLDDRSIRCRNAWSLKTYDINEAGQVHTYIGYLAELPYEEQLYWQSFNVWPDGTISDRAQKADLEGTWDLTYDPLPALKFVVQQLDAKPPEWWNPRGEALADAVRYPATDSPKEWADEILALDQLLVEGFLVKPLRKIAVAGGRTLDPNWASLRVMQEVLVAKGLSEDDAKGVVRPLQRLHGLRTDVKGHAALEKKAKAEHDARATNGTFRNHFHQLSAECDKSLGVILNQLGVKTERWG